MKPLIPVHILLRSEEHTSELQSPTTLFPYTTLFRSAVFFGTLFFVNAGTVKIANANAPGYETIDSGSYIINMGQATQSRANALLSFGRVYDLVNAYSTPLGK